MLRCNPCNGIDPCSPSGLVTGIYFSFLFYIFSKSETLLRVLLLTIPISGSLGLSRHNYPNIGLTRVYWSNQLMLNFFAAILSCAIRAGSVWQHQPHIYCYSEHGNQFSPWAKTYLNNCISQPNPEINIWCAESITQKNCFYLSLFFKWHKEST